MTATATFDWAEFKATLDHKPNVSPAGAYWRSKRTTADEAPKYFKFPLTPEGYRLAAAAYDAWKHGPDMEDIGRIVLDTPVVADRNGLRDLVKKWLYEQREQVEMGNKSLATYGDKKDKIQYLEQFWGNRGLSHFNEQAWGQYQQFIKERKKPNGESISDLRKLNIAKTAVEFLKWAYKQRYYLIPILTLEDYIFKPKAVEHADADFWTKEDIHKTLKVLNPKLKVFALLSLNCGFQSTDFANLKKSQVDLKSGRIITKRNKTKNAGGLLLNYKLWKCTVEAMSQCQSEHPELFFTTDEGNPIKNDSLEGSQRHVWDTLAKSWQGLKKRKKLKSFKFLRKVGPNILLESKEYGGMEHLHALYIGKTPSSDTWKSYINKAKGSPYPLLDDARDYVAKQLGLK